MIMSLREWYGEREILVTGSTSQIGRNLLEKLLRSFPGVKVHLVLRTTRDGIGKDERVERIFNSSGFDRLRQERPTAATRIKTYEGNLIQDKLGLSHGDRKALENVSIVFHVGGNSMYLLEFCRQLENLRAVIVVDELLRCKRTKIPESRTEQDGNYPIDLRLGIIRLPPVAPALREPMPGYVELLKSPTVLMAGAGHVYGRSDLPAEIVPVDVATNTLVVAAWDIGERKTMHDAIFYNAPTINCTWGDIVKKGYLGCSKYRYPNFRWYGITSSTSLHWWAVTIFEWLPSFIIDSLFWLFHREQRLLKEYHRVRDLLKDFESVTLRSVTVIRERINELAQKRLSPEESEQFPLQLESIDLETYLLCAAAATRKYVVSDQNLTIVQSFSSVMLLFLLIGFYLKFFF